MRLFRLICFLVLASAFQLAIGQTQPEQDFTERSKVELYPNPTTPSTEHLYVKLLDSEIPASKVSVALHNIIGNKMEIETEVVSEHELRIRVKDLAAGYYLVALKDEETNFRGIFKFLKR
jgi:hypothetical protein